MTVGPAGGRGRGVIPGRRIPDARQILPAASVPAATRSAMSTLTCRYLAMPGMVSPQLQCGLASVPPRGALLGSAPICSSTDGGAA